MKFIDLKTQYNRIKSQVHESLEQIFEHGQFILGPEVQELEQKLAEFVGVKYCIAVANGTDALLIALMAAGIKAGDEVITSPFTFIANAEMIALLGAKPVFVDINPETYNLDPNLLTQAITEKTKAIMPVSLYGQCADMKAINEIAQPYNIAVIEDAAQSFGAMHHGKRSCALSKLAATSFFPSKPLGTYGEGGAVFTDDDELAQIMNEIHVHGQQSRYYHVRLGVNSRLNTIQAAFLLAKLKLFQEEINNRQVIAQHYNERLQSKVKIPFVKDENLSVYAQYTIEVPNRERFQAHMSQQGVPTMVHYPLSIHQQPVFSALGYKTGDFPYAEHAAHHVVSLPMHPYLTEQEIEQVIKAVMLSI